jgi:hypothetical protein
MQDVQMEPEAMDGPAAMWLLPFRASKSPSGVSVSPGPNFSAPRPSASERLIRRCDPAIDAAKKQQRIVGALEGE